MPLLNSHSHERSGRHYGDYTRALFVSLAVLISLCLTLNWDNWSETAVLAVGIPSIVILIILAGITSPRGKPILLLDAAVSAAGIVATQPYAIAAYAQGHYFSFATLECIGVGFLFTLYFSVKAVREMDAQKAKGRELTANPRQGLEHRT